METKPTIDYEKVLRDSGMPTTETDISAAFAAVVDEAGLMTNTSRMSPFWRLINTIVTRPVLWLKEALINVTLKNMYLATAAGAWLDMFAWGVNLKRKPATAAQGIIRFYKAAGASAVTVPAGTVIQTERINGEIYRVSTTESGVMAEGVTHALLPVTADATGGAFNLAPGYFRLLPVAVSGIERVQNEEGWLLTPGADAESDNDLRDRCRNQYNLVGNYHTDAVYRGMIAAVAGLSIDRIFFLHDAPRGAGTANAYLLLDSGVISQPFVEAVNDYITNQGHHGHGDDMQCLPMPETHHALTVTLFVEHLANYSQEQIARLKTDVGNLIRCAFRENTDYPVKKTWPYSRFSFSNLGREIHREFSEIESLTFSLGDILSELGVPRLQSLTIEVKHA
ncbi:baseplate J/gp47 family protein [Xenorhabdus bovienii]|uniref:baseplate J/gp47 family protein n=1 Tax=Xenorhabdus bovienii TaxID=40576 RepID=UPI0004DA5CBA|nr:baseplate J/gp47 family protein [Xenorhabdus bovienii]CDG88162.1 putative phage gene [Xenorhabdus bovienii str. feltiae France]CDG93173.1 putative phage gene [Xenorhabdus bovienii str. feltiae Florida]